MVRPWPDWLAMGRVEASDLLSYLVLQTSFVTAKEFKAHKSLQFVCGWVKEVKTWIKGEKFLIIGRVSSTRELVDLIVKYFNVIFLY